MIGRLSLLLSVLASAIFLVGLVGRGMLQPSESRTLTRPLEDLPSRFGDFVATRDHEMSEGEERMLKADEYIIRKYESPEGQEFTE